MREHTQYISSFARTKQSTERQPTGYQYVISELIKQRLTGKDSLQ